MPQPPLKVLTFNAGLVRLTARHLIRAFCPIPPDMEAKTTISSRLLDTPLWTMAQWIDERAQALPEVLSTCDADVLCLQEVFEDHHCRHLLSHLKTQYPYHARQSRPPIFGLRDGLLILSKYPITQSRFVPFRCAPWEEKLLINRGTLIAWLDVPDLPAVPVLTTHPTAAVAFRGPYGAAASALRLQQIQELIALITTLSPAETLIVTGDMNCGPTSGAPEYQALLNAGLVDAFTAATDRPNTAESITFDLHNILNRRCDPVTERSERIDHILVHEKSIFTSRQAEVRFTDASIAAGPSLMVPPSDHYGVLVTF